MFYWTYGFPVDQLPQKDTFELIPKGAALNHATLLNYTGTKQPSLWLPDSGWHWVGRGMPTCKAVAIPGEAMEISYTVGRMCTLTTAFFHQADHGAPEAYA